MNRAEAIKALIAGKAVERAQNVRVNLLRWHEENGVQVCIEDRWHNEEGSGAHQYREAWKPREFLDRWVEVQSFEKAELAGYQNGKPTAMCCDGQTVGATWDSPLPTYGYWVKRKASK